MDSHKADFIIRAVTDDEIKDAIFSIADDKAHGPDDFTTVFFKKAWDIISLDVILVVREFFSNGKLLKENSHTIISLVPKVTVPTKISDYRPISCCIVVYKCISKIIANLLKGDLGDLASIN